MKTTGLAICAFALSTTLAFAQPSQAQGGAATGPTSNSATSGTSGMNSGATNNGSGMQSGSTTGMSSGGGSGMTNSGGANGNPNSMPKTTTESGSDASTAVSSPK